MMAAVLGKAALEEGAAWYIDAFHRPYNKFGFRADLVEEDVKKYHVLLGRIRAGEALGEEIPDQLWIKSGSANGDVKKLPHFTIADEILVVSQQVANVLTQFDLGASTLHSVQLLKADRETPFPGTWFIFQIAERKEAFEPEHSEGYMEPMFPWNTFMGSINLDSEKIQQIYLNQSALSGPDLWVDPRLVSLTVFVSAALMNALKAADVLNSSKTLRCPVIKV